MEIFHGRILLHTPSHLRSVLSASETAGLRRAADAATPFLQLKDVIILQSVHLIIECV